MPMIIAALVSMLLQALRQYLPGIIGRVLLAFGIGLVTHEVALPAIKSFIQSKLSALGPVLVAYFDYTGFGIAVTMILSAWAATYAQKAMLAKLGSN